VQIDKPGDESKIRAGDAATGGIGGEVAYCRNFPRTDADIGTIRWRPGAVENTSISKNYIKFIGGSGLWSDEYKEDKAEKKRSESDTLGKAAHSLSEVQCNRRFR